MTSVPDLFEVSDKNDKLFIRRSSTAHFQPNESAVQVQVEEKMFPANHMRVQTDFGKAADVVMLNNYTPASVIVNKSLDVVQFRGRTGAYLEAASGKPTHSILKMARKELAFELRSILRKATKGSTVSKKIFHF